MRMFAVVSVWLLLSTMAVAAGELRFVPAHFNDDAHSLQKVAVFPTVSSNVTVNLNCDSLVLSDGHFASMNCFAPDKRYDLSHGDRAFPS